MQDGRLAAMLLGTVLGAAVGIPGVLVVTSRAARFPQAGEPELAREVGALRDALERATQAFLAAAERERSRQSADELVPAAAPAREPVGGSVDLDALFARIDERLSRLEVILASAPAGSSAVRYPSGPLGTPDFPANEVVQSTEFLRQHLLWDYARVAERYGLPDHSVINDAGYVSWGYSSRERNGAWFDFVDGVVIRVR